MKTESIYEFARERYAELGVDTEAAIERVSKISISLHCWQGDDVGGFESAGTELGSGLAVTGNYPGKARTPNELRDDLEKALSLIPGKHRLNLHAFYLENDGKKVDRNEIEVSHFENWIEWCAENKIGMDFNPTCFSHPKADDGFTLSHQDAGIREFWIEHCIASRKIGDEIGRRLGSPCVNNFWVPDGYKDTPADRLAPRERLRDSLDTIFAEKLEHNLDAVESKLFGIGSESFVVGSHEFYFGYAQANKKLLCLDAGHFHPTEVVSEKLSACLLWFPELLLHVSRGVRWDSDHVVTQNDELLAITREIIANNAEERVRIGLDFFDASINRVAAWTIGTRNVSRGLIMAALEPTAKLREMENEGDYTGRLALQEELKSLPFGAVWDEYCERAGVPVGRAWLDEVRNYERDVLSKRD